MHENREPPDSSGGEAGLSKEPEHRDGGPAPTGDPEEARYSDPIDDALDDTFPASDPPSWSGLTAGGV